MNIANCSKCGKIFARTLWDLCPSCMKELDEMYEKVYSYLRENRGSTIQQVSEATEVPMRIITKFIREGRISIIDSPNMSYPCESCGTPIREHHLCDACRNKLTKEWKWSMELEQRRREAAEQRQPSMSYRIKDRLLDRHSKNN